MPAYVINGVTFRATAATEDQEAVHASARRFSRKMSTETRSQSTAWAGGWTLTSIPLAEADANSFLGLGNQLGYQTLTGDRVDGTVVVEVTGARKRRAETGVDEYVVELVVRERLTATGGGTIVDPDPGEGTDLVWKVDVNGRWYATDTGTADGYAKIDGNGRIYIDDTASSGLRTFLSEGRVIVET